MLALTVVLSVELARKLTDFLKSSNINYDIEKYKKITIVFIHINTNEKNYVFDILAEYIVNVHIKRHINSYLDKEFYFFDKNEKTEVLKDVLSKINKSEISSKIKSFFDEKDEIILDGFFKFRMKGYMDYIDVLIHERAGEKASEKELNEFIKLLKYFVSIGESVCENVHVHKKDDDYIICDDNGSSPLDMTGIMYEFSDMDSLPEDELLSGLVSIAPKHIVMHGENICPNDESMSVICKVFENSIEFCGGKCEKCREIKNLEKNNILW